MIVIFPSSYLAPFRSSIHWSARGLPETTCDNNRGMFVFCPFEQSAVHTVSVSQLLAENLTNTRGRVMIRQVPTSDRDNCVSIISHYILCVCAVFAWRRDGERKKGREWEVVVGGG